MPLTFGEIKKLVAPYAGRGGKCVDSKEVPMFAKQVMEYLLYSGSNAAERKICILAHKGCISLPPEVEIPIKAKIDRRVSEVWNKWFSFHSAVDGFDRCPPCGQVLSEDGEQTPLAYMLPSSGSVVGVMGTCNEKEDSFVTVQGKDPSGQQVFTMFDGEKIAGERFRLVKGQLRYGQVVWGKIEAVVKSITEGYVHLYAVNPESRGFQRFLASWSPLEEKPMYRRFKVTSRECPPIAHISMLCRIRLRENYHDNEVTPFDNSLAIMLGAQRLLAETNNDIQTAGFKKQGVEDILDKEAGYKKGPSGPVDVFFPLSGGAVRNII